MLYDNSQIINPKVTYFNHNHLLRDTLYNDWVAFSPHSWYLIFRLSQIPRQCNTLPH